MPVEGDERAQATHRPAATIVLSVSVPLAAGAAPSLAPNWAIAVPVLIALAAAIWWLSGHEADQLLDATVLVAGLWVFLAVPGLLWPIPGALALLLAGWWAWRQGRWFQWRAWLRVGRIGTFAWSMCIVIAVLSVVGLLVWNRIFDGELPQAYRDLTTEVPAPLAVMGALLFLIVNGAVEDSIFAGVLLGATERVLPIWLAVGTVAFSFGLAHWHGVPNGPVGIVMAGSWGLVLALLRLRTGGMGATYVAHVVADTTIIVMLVPALLS